MILKTVNIKGDTINFVFKGQEYIVCDDSVVVSVDMQNVRIMVDLLNTFLDEEHE